MNKKNKVGTTAVYITIIVFVAKILGFIKQMFVANCFGATIQTDLISISEGLIGNTDYLIVQALSTAFVPTYIYAKRQGNNEEKKFVINTIGVFLGVSVFISIFLFFTAPYSAKILAPTYSRQEMMELARYIRFFSPTLIALVLSAIFNSLLKGNESFIPGELISVVQSVLLIVFIFLFGNEWGAKTLAYSFVCYTVVTMIYLGIWSKRYWGLNVCLPTKDENVIKLLRMMGPLLLGYSIVFVNQQVDKIIVSGLGEGVVSAMGYAAVLSNFVCTFIGSISGVLFVYITNKIAANEQKEAADYLVKSVVQMVTVVLPVFVLTICNSYDIVSIVFGRGRFDAYAVKTCSYALVGYSLMFIPYVFRELFSRFQYSYGDSKHPMINSSIGIVFNIVASIVLSRFWGVMGVTVATSLSVLFCGGLNVLSSKKKNEYIFLRNMLTNIIPWVVGTFFCAMISFVGNRWFANVEPIVRFVPISLISCMGYALINIKIIIPMINNFRKKN